MLGFYQSQSFKISNSNFPRNNKSLDLQRVDIISVSHTRREREPAKDKFEHWIERIKTLHFTFHYFMQFSEAYHDIRYDFNISKSIIIITYYTLVICYSINTVQEV